jgi:hypothetical protein
MGPQQLTRCCCCQCLHSFQTEVTLKQIRFRETVGPLKTISVRFMRPQEIRGEP